jgi:dipeptidase E
MIYSPEFTSLNDQAQLVLIGGGAYSTTSRPMLEFGIDLTGKQKPNVLIVPTPKNKQADYDALALKGQSMFRDSIGTEVSMLHPFGEMPNFEELEERINTADAFYISGGNTRFAMEQWRAHGVDTLLTEAMRRGKVMTGISAGALAWFKDSYSDSMSYEVDDGQPWEYIEVKGIDVIPVAATPHFNSTDTPDGRLRSAHFGDYLSAKSVQSGNIEYGLGIDNNAALLVTHGLINIIRTDPNRTLHILTSDGHQSELDAPTLTISKLHTTADQLTNTGITWSDFNSQFSNSSQL